MKYHFVLTLQWPNGATSTTTGVLAPNPGETRGSLLVDIWKGLLEHSGVPMNANVLFWSLEPDKLNGE